MPGEIEIRGGLELERSFGEVREKPLRMNEIAFHAFYERTARPLFHYLLRVSRRRDIAEDVLQESYCRLLSAKLPEMDEAQTRNYLFKIATNLLRDRGRRNKETATPSLDSPAPSGNHADQAAMRQAFERLKLRERELLWLAYVEGASHNEIADCTGLKPASVRLLLYRARRRLAGFLRGDSREKPKVNG